MLSIDHPPDPSCSSKLSVLKTDEGDSEDLAFQEADPPHLGGTPTPNFSIRNYVSASRSKGIGTSWPFRPQLLQLCLKHGVKYLLPPFEPPKLVRGQSRHKDKQLGQVVARSEAGQFSPNLDLLEPKHGGLSDDEQKDFRCQSCLPPDRLVIGCLDHSPYPSTEDGKSTVNQGDSFGELIHSDAKTATAVTSDDQTEGVSVQIDQHLRPVSLNYSVSEVNPEVEVAEPASWPQKLKEQHEPLKKNCRLVVKLGSIADTSQGEDLVSNSSTVSDPMASKICPVCKVFSSTSNTTLNAHIDQCLSVESNSKQAVSNFLKPKVKPAKKRSMVDIYITAPHSTLEDLDRRNGTNWALELASVAAVKEVRAETQRPKLLPQESSDSKCEGAVYVDSNGIKLRILSKFNDMPPFVSQKELKPKNNVKCNESKNILISTKKHLRPKYSKNKKLKVHEKKLWSSKLLKAKAQREGDKDIHQKEESLTDFSNAPEQSISSVSATLKQWVCSKRSDLRKKMNSKGNHRTMKNLVPATKQLGDNIQLYSDNFPAVEGHRVQFCRLSEDIVTSQKARNVDFLSSPVHSMDAEMEISPNPHVSNYRQSMKVTSAAKALTQKSSRSSELSISSTERKSKKINMCKKDKYDNPYNMTMTPDCTPPSAKCQKSYALEKKFQARSPSFSLEALNVVRSNKRSTSKTFRRHRMMSRTVKQGEEILSTLTGETHGSFENLDVDIAYANKKMRTRHSNIFKCHIRSGTGNISDHAITCGNDVRESEQREDGSKADWGHSMMTNPPLDSECHDPENEMQIENLAARGNLTDSSIEIISVDLATTVPVNLEAHYQTCSVIEPPGEPIIQQPYDQQVVCHAHVSSNEVVDKDFQLLTNMEFRREKESFVVEATDCQVGLASIQEFSACLTSHHGGMDFKNSRDNSSITSNREASNHDSGIAFDGDSLESPASTASIRPFPSLNDFTFTESESDLLIGGGAVQDKFGLPLISTESIRRSDEGNAESMNQEVKAILHVDNYEQLSDDKPFCCSCRESLSDESQILKQSATLASKGKRVSRLHINPRTSSSFTYQILRTDTMTTSCLESPTQSISNKPSSESAVSAPACTNAGSLNPSPKTEVPSPSNPILRLMGKDLLVMNKEENAQPHTPTLDYLGGKSVSPLGFAPSNNVWKQENFQYHHLSGSEVIDQAPSMANQQISAAQFQNGLMMQPDQHSLPEKSHKKPILPCCMPHMMKEEILNDDSPGTSASPTNISVSNPTPSTPFCFPIQTILSNDVSGGTRPLFPNLHLKRGSNADRPVPFISSPSIFQSPAGHMRPFIYYSQTLH
ncbi:uncharacterized protein [Typha angustifolia]|uniref:uncharacterized protein isoform X1 n=1 Tax=Typha angustifolia TaxID=59011 RepID=UPI003C2D2659